MRGMREMRDERERERDEAVQMRMSSRHRKITTLNHTQKTMHNKHTCANDDDCPKLEAGGCGAAGRGKSSLRRSIALGGGAGGACACAGVGAGGLMGVGSVVGAVVVTVVAVGEGNVGGKALPFSVEVVAPVCANEMIVSQVCRRAVFVCAAAAERGCCRMQKKMKDINSYRGVICLTLQFQ